MGTHLGTIWELFGNYLGTIWELWLFHVLCQRLGGWLAGWLAGWLTGWLAGWSVGRLPRRSLRKRRRRAADDLPTSPPPLQPAWGLPSAEVIADTSFTLSRVQVFRTRVRKPT